MGKYIDVDKLIGEIKNFSSKEYGDNTFGDDIVNGALDYVIEKIIPSLQQDETQVDKLLCSKIWWEEQGWIMIPPDATIKGIDSLLKQVRKKLQQEQPESDIEKEIDEYIEKEFGERWDGCVPVSCFDLVMMANHFYERGMSVMRERITNPDYNQKVVEKIKSEYPMDETNARKEDKTNETV